MDEAFGISHKLGCYKQQYIKECNISCLFVWFNVAFASGYPFM